MKVTFKTYQILPSEQTKKCIHYIEALNKTTKKVRQE